jgi:hypothetical protein
MEVIDFWLVDIWEVVRPSVWKSSALGVIHGDGTEVRRWSTYEQGENRRGEERRDKETDGCPLTYTPYMP